MRRCSGSRALVPLFRISPQTSSPPVLSCASSLDFPLTCLAGSFNTPPRAVSSPLRTSRLTSRFLYRLSFYRSALPQPPPLFLAPGPPPVDPLPPQGPAPSGVSQVYPLSGVVPVEVAGDSGAASGAASWGEGPGGAEPGGVESEGAGSGGAEPGGAEPKDAEPAGVATGGAEPEGVEPRGAESEGAESGGAETQGAALSGGPAGALPAHSFDEETLELEVLELLLELVVLEVLRLLVLEVLVLGVLELSELVVFEALEVETLRSLELLGMEALEQEELALMALGLEALALVALELEELELVELEVEALAQEALEQEELELLTLELELLELEVLELEASGLAERRKPASRPASPVCTGLRVPRPRPPPVPEHTLWHFILPLFHCVFLCLLLLKPLFVSSLTLSLTALMLPVPPLESASPPSVGGECALGTDVLQDRQEDFECLATAIPRFASMLLAPEGDPDAPDIPTPRSYAETITIPPSRANIVGGMWIFRVKRPPGSPPAFKHDYELHSLDFSTAFLQGSLHEEIWLRRPPGFTGSFPADTHSSLRRPVYGLRQAPREWHDTMRTTLVARGFTPTADPSLFLRIDTSLPPFYIQF
ncbi:unnamed protein product [Closterium sp. NIES-53]